MSNNFKFLTIFLVSLATGCAHQIQLTPNLDDLRGTTVDNKIEKNVGYYISAVDKATEVISPGGGGDDVKYYPYKDTEAALNTLLSKVFSRVYSVPSLDDSAFVEEKGISYIFTSSIKTDSSSSSAFTWPPTDFTFELTCTATDVGGKEVWVKTVSAAGNAEYDEFKSDFSLSARRASEEAYEQMLAELIKAETLH